MIEYIFAAVALVFGLLFFIIAARYYLFTATIFLMQLVSPLRGRKRNGRGANPNGPGNSRDETQGQAQGQDLSGKDASGQRGHGNGRNGSNGKQSGATNGFSAEPFVSIHLATYNEPNVIERIVSSCMSLDYSNYEVIVVDDSTDRTTEILEKWKAASSLPTSPDGGQVQTLLAYRRPELKIIHRKDRTGFKGGALNEALRHMDPRAEFVVILDADFVPSPDLLHQFLHHVPVSTIDELFRNVRKLDEDYAAAKIGIAEYLDKREELLVRTVGRRPAHEIAAVGGKVLSQLDRLYYSKGIDLETYLERRATILATMDLAGVSPLKADPLGERAATVNTFELDQLFATGRIDLGEYMNRRRRHGGQDVVAAKAQSLPFRQIFELDLDFAEGKVASRDEYLARRAKLVETTLPEENRHELLKRFELDQSLAAGKITSTQYVEELEKLDSNGNGSKNGNEHAGSIPRRGRKSSIWKRKNGNGNGHRTRRWSNGHGNGLLGNGNGYGQLAAVQGYQWHWLNKSENWLTQGVRAEFSGSYVIERTCQEIYGNMKMIAGSVFMIRADLLRKYGWSTSITEDWELTCRLYRDGYKIAYTPLIQVPAEAPSTVKRLVRQRQRWAEGHTYNAKKYFWALLRSPHLNLREKSEVVYFAPYYLQSVFFMIGSTFWMLSELRHEYVPFWTAVFGWSLLLSNLIALPLMNLAGLFVEGSVKRDFGGILSTIILSYVLAPFQAFSSLKGLLEKHEGTWIRTFKTGRITEPIGRLKLRKFLAGTRKKRAAKSGHAPSGPKGMLGQLFAHKKGVSTVCLLIITMMLAASLLAAFSVPEASGQEIVDNLWSLDNVGTGTSGWYYMRDMSTPSAGSLALPRATTTRFLSDRTGSNRYITSPIPGSTTWTLFLSWSSKHSQAFWISFTISTSQGTTLQTTIVTGNIALPSGTGPGTALQNVNQASDVTPSQTPYDIVLELTTPNGRDVTLNTGSGGSYLQYSGTLVPEALLPLLALIPALPLIAFKKSRRNVQAIATRTLCKVLGFSKPRGDSDGT